ncbi:MAG TPA: type II toxin-antitoxin system VapC family toxin [Mycobacterium sp.]
MNVLLYAFRRESPRHSSYAEWLKRVMVGHEPVGLSELVLSAVVRLATFHRIYREPSSTEETLQFCRTLRNAPAAISLRPGPRHWAIFETLCRDGNATANLVPAAYHAALAIENDATWITNDRGFARFPLLQWRLPFA